MLIDYYAIIIHDEVIRVIRKGKLDDISEVNVLRKEVNDLHVKGEPGIFKGFSFELQEYIKQFVGDDKKKSFIVYEENGKICGYAMLEIIKKEETSYKYATKYLEVHELGISKNNKGKGYGKQLINEVKRIASELGVNEIRLDAWTFNQHAIEFYKRNDYKVYREYFRLSI